MLAVVLSSSAAKCRLPRFQQEHVVAAVEALAPLVLDHDLIITHGNGCAGPFHKSSRHQTGLAPPDRAVSLAD